MVKPALIGTLCLALASAAAAAADDTFINEVARQMEHIRSNAEEIVGEQTVQDIKTRPEEGAKTYAAEIAEIQQVDSGLFQQGVDLAKEMAGSQWKAVEATGQLPDAASPNTHGDTPTRYRIFVSQRMPDAEVKNLIEMYRERPDVAIVLRGMLPNQTMTGVHSWMYRLLSPIQPGMPIPNLTMDPEPFNELGVDQVPVIARYDDAGKLQTYALGMTSISWIEDRFKAGARGGLGAFGPTIRVAEEDIIKVMMRRAEQYDWEGAKKGAIGRFWKRTEMHDLPRVHTPRVRYLDPTIEISQTIRAPDGQVIANAGDRINPLEAGPFTQTLAFFDPADPEQVLWAKALVKHHDGLRIVLMASQLRTLDGLEALGSLSDSIGTSVFSLPKDVRERFSIERVPTVVTSNGSHFVIDEQHPSHRPGAN